MRGNSNDCGHKCVLGLDMGIRATSTFTFIGAMEGKLKKKS